MANPVTRTPVIDPAVYGAEPVVPADRAGALAGEQDFGYTPPQPVPVTESLSPRLQAQGAAKEAQAAKPEASIGESLGAAWEESGTMRVWDFFKKPTFEPVPGHNPAPNVKMFNRPLSMDEEKFLLSSRSPAEDAYVVERVQQVHANNELMGDHPFLAMAAAVLDPIYLGADIVSAGTARLATGALTGGRLARLGRPVAAATSGAAAAGISAAETQVAPVSALDILVNVGMGTLGGTMLFNPRTKRLEPKDPEFPRAEVDAHLEKGAQEATVQPRANAEPTEVKEFQARVDADSARVSTERAHLDNDPAQAAAMAKRQDELARMPEQTAVAGSARAKLQELATTSQDPLVRKLAGLLERRTGPLLDSIPLTTKQGDPNGRSYVRHQSGTFAGGGNTRLEVHLWKGGDSALNDDWTAMHELAHAATIERLDLGRSSGVLYPEHAKVYQQFEALRKRVRKTLKAKGDLDYLSDYLTKNSDEFVAGLFSGDTTFLRKLADMELGRKSVLTELLDTIRRVLGLDASETSALAKAMRLTDDLLGLEAKGNTSSRVFNTPEAAAKSVLHHVASTAQKTGDKLAWNLHKSLSKWSREIADILVDNPLDMSKASATAQREAVRRELTMAQVRYEDALTQELADRGYGLLKRALTDTSGAMRVQAQIERELAAELLARQERSRTGVAKASGASPGIQRMADAWDETMKNALTELKRAGVAGADQIDYLPGYFSRSANPAGIQNVMDRLTGLGRTEAEALADVRGLVRNALRAANPNMSADLAHAVSSAWVDRAIRKGDMEDVAFRQHVGNQGVGEVRDLLKRSGVSPQVIDQAVELLEGVQDEAGKAPFMKSRLNMNMQTSTTVNGMTFSMIDLLHTDLTRSMDAYLDRVSGMAGMARVGIQGPSDISKLRTQLVKGIENHAERKEAADLFDNTIKYMLGQPTGETVPAAMRKLSAVTQMTALAASGLWQITELATTLAKYGMVRTFSYFGKTMPGFGEVARLVKDPAFASDLRSILSQGSYNDVRIRPFIQRMEDNFHIGDGDVLLSKMTQMKQLVPYINGMKYLHKHQSILTANLVVDSLKRGAGTSPEAIKFKGLLEKYGIDAQVVEDANRMIQQHGLNVQSWDDAVWDAVRPGLSKMMDESVLKSRLGEVPAFAQFSALGKFLFTFRSFVLGAHNKILSGTLSRQGFTGLGVMMLYQYPLAMLAVMADNTIAGREPLSVPEAAARAVSQMGSIGLLSELWGVASGQKTQVGSPGTIGIDSMYNVVSNMAQLDAGGTADALMRATPLVAIFPLVRAFGESLK